MKTLVDILLSRKYASVLLIFGIALVVYANSINNVFQYDDRHSIIENPHIRTLENTGRFFLQPELFSRDADKAMYRPLLLVSYALNYAWSQYEVESYHWVNMALHASCSILVWLILQELGYPICMALLGGLLFAVHPAGSEPVNYISSRSELLAALGVLASFWAYRRSFGVAAGNQWRALSLVFFAIGLLGKSVAITLPALLLSSDYYSGHLDRRAWMRYLPYGAVALAYLFVIEEFFVKALLAAPVRPWDIQFGTQVKALVYYAKLVVLPSHLNVHHAFTESSLLAVAALGPGALLLSVGFLLVRARQQLASVFMALSWIFITLLPTLVVPLNVLVNEHRLYLPLVGFAMFGAGLRGLERLPGLLWGTPVLLGLLGVLTVARNNVWESEYSLWADAATKAPGEVRAYVYMGNAAKSKGRFAEAVVLFNRALELEPENIQAHNNLGNVYMNQGQYSKAAQIYGALLETEPKLADVRYNLARALQKDGEAEVALAHYRQIPEDSFHYNLTLNNIGVVFEQHSALDSALIYYGRALALKPEAVDILSNFQRIGHHFYSQQQYGKLEVLCRQILQWQSGNREVRFLLALGLFSARQYSASIVQYEKIVADFPNFGRGYLELANALGASGRLQEALQIYRHLLDANVSDEARIEGRKRLHNLEQRLQK